MDDYEGPGEVQFNQNTMAEATSISVSHNSNSTPVTTMRKGLAGRSRGAYTVSIQVENAVPKAGLEAEFIEQCVENATVAISHLFGGRTYVYEGWIESVDTSNGTDQAASASFSVMAGPPTIV